MKFYGTTKIVHWIAVFAILMSALLPSISQSLPTNQSKHFFDLEICSISGVKIIQSNSSEQNKNPHIFSKSHCPYCALHVDTFLPISSTHLYFREFTNTSSFPDLYYQSPKRLFAWITLPSRAPPFVS